MEFSELSGDEQTVLQQVYGLHMLVGSNDIARNRISDIFELNTNEQWFFSHRNFVSPYLLQQTLYKIKGKVVPVRMSSAINRMVEQVELLRSNYCELGTRAVRVVWKKRIELPRIVYRNLVNEDPKNLDGILKKLMEADMRESFDLTSGNLMRLGVYRTGPKEFALLITSAKIVTDQLDIAVFLRMISDIKASSSITDPLFRKNNLINGFLMTDSIRNYWKKVLSDFPRKPKMPYKKIKKTGTYQQRSFRMSIPRNIMSDLMREARKNRIMLVAILETAWGLMLQHYNPDIEISMCLLVPGRKSAKNDNMSTGAFNIIPVRLGCGEGLTVQQLVNAQLQQFIVSRPYACFDWSALQDISGREGILFDNCLSFLDFLDDDESYSMSEAVHDGNQISNVVWDAHGMPLGAYFCYADETVSVNFLYDGRQFDLYGVKSLAEQYSKILQYMLTDWDAGIEGLLNRIAVRTSLVSSDIQAREDTVCAKVQTFLSRLGLFQGTATGILQPLMDISRVVTRYQGDRISEEEIRTQAIFVMEGKLARYMDSGDGWYNLLDIAGSRRWLNELALLSNQNSKLSAEVFTEEAELVFIPIDKFKDILAKHSEVKDNIIKHLLSEMEKYQKLWVHS